ncbi:MAG: lysophospholipid acyltransferase family protein [Devosiaceae bacterium]
MAPVWIKRLSRNSFVQTIAGNTLAGYMQLVHKTARVTETDIGARRAALHSDLPAIFTFWHGEHFLVALAAPNTWDLHAMISRSADGTLNAIAANRLGVTVVRGAGDPKRSGKQKGGARAFLQSLRVLETGGSLGLTADVPKVARTVSPGLIKLAKKSGRPIVPVSYVTHPRITLSSWDKASVALPFTKAAIGVSEPLYFDDADNEDDACALLKDRLDTLEQHSYAAIGGQSAFDPEASANV